MNIWKVSWNSRLYDYKSIIHDFKNGLVKDNIIKQSKGMANMKIVPMIGDLVYVSCNKQRIMKCKVVSNFITNLDEKDDIFNLGTVRPHTNNDTYLKMVIIKTYDNPKPLRGCQRTWSKYKLA